MTSVLSDLLVRSTQNSVVAYRASAVLPSLEAAYELVPQVGAALSPLPMPLLLPAHFFYMAGAAVLAGTRTVLAGQPFDAPAQFRVALENAGYAIYTAGDSTLDNVWRDRHRDPAALTAAKSAFTVKNVKTAITAHAPHIRSVFDSLYDQVIDHGAHPNERALTGRLEAHTTSSDIFSTLVVLVDDPALYEWGLTLALRTCTLALYAAESIFAAQIAGTALPSKIRALSLTA